MEVLVSFDNLRSYGRMGILGLSEEVRVGEGEEDDGWGEVTSLGDLVPEVGCETGNDIVCLNNAGESNPIWSASIFCSVVR